MVRDLSRGTLAPRNDPHDWNSLDHYQSIHELRMENHEFVIRYKDTLVFERVGESSWIRLRGFVYCRKGVILEVDKWLETNGSIPERIRGRSYLYVAWVRGMKWILRYHNKHKDESEYIHRICDPRSGNELLEEVLRRDQFPTLSQILDELEVLAECFNLQDLCDPSELGLDGIPESADPPRQSYGRSIS